MQRSAVVGPEKDGNGEIIAFVELSPGASLTGTAARARLRGSWRLPSPIVPVLSCPPVPTAGAQSASCRAGPPQQKRLPRHFPRGREVRNERHYIVTGMDPRLRGDDAVHRRPMTTPITAASSSPPARWPPPLNPCRLASDAWPASRCASSYPSARRSGGHHGPRRQPQAVRDLEDAHGDRQPCRRRRRGRRPSRGARGADGYTLFMGAIHHSVNPR